MDKQPIILTFDDGFASHFDTACPILKKYRLTATFFICGAFIEHPYLKGTFMEWEEVIQLSKDDFEIGSHLYQHFGMTDPNINHYANIKSLEQKFKQMRLPKPVTLSYPGYHVNAEAIKVIRGANYRFARAGCEKHLPFDDFQHGGIGGHYNYLEDNPYNINCTGIFGKNFGTNEFIESLQTIQPGEIPVYCFHSFIGRGIKEAPETDISVDTFTECMDYIASGPFQTIRMRDIEAHI